VKKAISVTLTQDNLLWLKGQAAATSRGSLSEVLDGLVTEARMGGRAEPASVRSVRGTIDLPDDDAELLHADAYVRTLFETSLRRPLVVREDSALRRKGAKRPRG